MSVKRSRLAVVLIGACALAACSGGPGRVKSVTPPPATVSPAREVDAAFDLLMAGQTGAADKRLKALLKREPGNPAAQLLRDSIARDPKDLLGPDSYAYTVRAGDTITGLAERLLGNRLKAYQLLRYNGLKAPAVLTPGQSVRIPGEMPRAEPVRRLEPTAPSTTPKPKPVAPKPASPTAPAANPAAARQARAAGLAALNQGNVGRAVALLRRAAALDPGNPVIARDLARAERIAATVRARK